MSPSVRGDGRDLAGLQTRASDRPPAQPPRRPELPRLTSLRAFAAVTVLLLHIQPWKIIPFLEPLTAGYAGVSVFFVLSGFILTWSHNPRQSKRHFYIRRFARVYPSHLVVFAAVLAVAAATGSTGEPIALVLNLFLLQAWFTSDTILHAANEVAWSLSCEVFFYSLFPFTRKILAALSLRTMWTVVAGAFAVYAVLAVSVATRTSDPELLQVMYCNPLARFSEFLLGIATARAVMAGVPVRNWALIVSGAVAVVGQIVIPQWPTANVWAAPFAAVLIAVLAQRDLAGRPGVLRWRWLQFAGRISFAFYLVHLLLIEWFWLMWGTGGYSSAAAFACSCLVAAALHFAVEVPANRWIVTATGRWWPAGGRHRGKTTEPG